MDLIGFRLAPHDLELCAFGTLAHELFTTVWVNSACMSSNAAIAVILDYGRSQWLMAEGFVPMSFYALSHRLYNGRLLL